MEMGQYQHSNLIPDVVMRCAKRRYQCSYWSMSSVERKHLMFLKRGKCMAQHLGEFFFQHLLGLNLF